MRTKFFRFLIVFTVFYVTAGAKQNTELCKSFYSGYLETHIWDRKVGKLWHSVVQKLDIPSDGVVVELGPGGRTKVGHGLAAIGFKGTLYIVEPEPNVLQTTIDLYKKLLPNAILIGIAKPFKNAVADIKNRPDAILANHLLDDAITYASATPEIRKAIFEVCYTDCSVNWVRRAWEIYEKDPVKLDGVVKSVVSDFVRFVRRTKARTVGLSQYPSTYFQEMGILGPDLYANRALESIRTRLRVKFGNIDGLHEAGELNQLASDWMLAH